MAEMSEQQQRDENPADGAPPPRQVRVFEKENKLSPPDSLTVVVHREINNR